MATYAAEQPSKLLYSVMIGSGSLSHIHPADSRLTPAVCSLDAGQEGPLSRDEIKQGYARGQIDMHRLFWSAGMPQPLRLGSIRELRWLIATRTGGHAPRLMNDTIHRGKQCS